MLINARELLGRIDLFLDQFKERKFSNGVELTFARKSFWGPSQERLVCFERPITTTHFQDFCEKIFEFKRKHGKNLEFCQYHFNVLVIRLEQMLQDGKFNITRQCCGEELIEVPGLLTIQTSES